MVYFAIFLLSLLMLKCYSNFDTVFGFVAYLRRKGYEKTQITLILILYLLWLFAIPVVFAVIWGVGVRNYTTEDPVQAASVTFTVIISTYVMLSFSTWYGAKWYLGRLSGTLLLLAIISGWGFALVILLIPDYFSYSGTSAILFTTNFLPLTYIIYKKNVNNDIPLITLFKEIAQMLSQTQAGKEDIQEKETREHILEEKLDQIVSNEN